MVVPLPGTWGDFYSRPQVAVLGPELWVASDTPGGALWVIEERVPRRVTLADQGIAPTGVAARGVEVAAEGLELGLHHPGPPPVVA